MEQTPGAKVAVPLLILVVFYLLGLAVVGQAGHKPMIAQAGGNQNALQCTDCGYPLQLPDSPKTSHSVQAVSTVALVVLALSVGLVARRLGRRMTRQKQEKPDASNHIRG